jgi:agmatinase
VSDLRLLPPDPAFLGLPIATDLSRLEADAVIIGIPYGVPYPHAGPTVGCAVAPAALRRVALRFGRFRGHHDFGLDGPLLPPDRPPRLVDAGDVPGAADDGAGNGSRAEAAIGEILARGARPVVLGGDDSIPIPVLRAFAGHAEAPLTVVQIDAHLDFRDEVAGVREGYSSPMRRASEMGHVGRIIQVGLRGVGSARSQDVDDARARGNLLVTARQLRERGVGWLLDQLLPDGPVVLAFDCDGLDPSVCPAVSAVSPGGLSFDEADAIVAGVAPRLAGAIFTELVPSRDVNDLSTVVVARLIVTLLGRLDA